MDFIDLHCDTVTECYKQRVPLYDGALAFNLKKAKKTGNCAQTFALFIPDTVRGDAAADLYDALLAEYLMQTDNNPGSVARCRTVADIKAAWAAGRIAAILSVENGAALNSDIDRLYSMADAGVRFLTLTWNGANEIGGGAHSVGGLTGFGKRVVCECRKCGIFPDVSHLNDESFYDVASLCRGPIVATHSNLRSIVPNPRNLTEEQFSAIVESGGIAGINFYRNFLGDNGFDSLFRHLYRMLELGGEDNIALGSDFDGAQIDFSLNSIDKMPFLCDYLYNKGLPDGVIQKLFSKNVLRLLGENENDLQQHKK